MELLCVRSTAKGARLYTASVYLDLYFNTKQVCEALERLNFSVSDDLTKGAFLDETGAYLAYNKAAEIVMLDLAGHWGFDEEFARGAFEIASETPDNVFTGKLVS